MSSLTSPPSGPGAAGSASNRGPPGSTTGRASTTTTTTPAGGNAGGGGDRSAASAAGGGPDGGPEEVPHLLATFAAYLQRLQSPDFNPAPVPISSLALALSGLHMSALVYFCLKACVWAAHDWQTLVFSSGYEEPDVQQVLVQNGKRGLSPGVDYAACKRAASDVVIICVCCVCSLSPDVDYAACKRTASDVVIICVCCVCSLSPGADYAACKRAASDVAILCVLCV
eukprot:1156777-Pelagomonas_calceolata.AAC.3